jgi:hypothetical protein
VLLCGLGLRTFEYHAHDSSTAHPDSCAVCRVLHTPVIAPSAMLAVEALQAPAAERAVAPDHDLLPQAPQRTSLHLRAPPLA